MNQDDILNNRANLNAEDGTAIHNDCCGNELIFALKDQHHTFSLNLTTVLQCLKFAEEEGAIPHIGSMWWEQVASTYGIDLALVFRDPEHRNGP